MKRRFISFTIALFFLTGALFATAVQAAAAGGALDDFIFIDAAYEREDGAIQLTSSEIYVTGGYWLRNPVDAAAFVAIEFEFMMSEPYSYDLESGTGADGITVSFAPAVPTDLDFGEKMAFYGPGAFGVEFDTWYNWIRDDPLVPHIAVIQESVGDHLKTAEDFLMNDSEWHRAKICYANDEVKVYFDGVQVLAYAGVYRFESFYVGIGAATGGATQNQIIRNVKIITAAVGKFSAATKPANFISMTETSKNSRIWVLSFYADETYPDGTAAKVKYEISLNGNNANQKGEYLFDKGPLAGYTLVYDVKGNGSNIKELKLVK